MDLTFVSSRHKLLQTLIYPYCSQMKPRSLELGFDLRHRQV